MDISSRLQSLASEVAELERRPSADWRHLVDGTGLDPSLLTGLILTESGGDPWAWNPEPKYRWVVDARTGRPFRALKSHEQSACTPPPDFPSHPALPDDRDAEWWGQRASWGLCQVMGSVAREYGYDGWLPGLCDPETNIYYAVHHLNVLASRFLRDHGWDGVLAAYNAGSPRYRDDGKFINQDYVDRVRSLAP